MRPQGKGEVELGGIGAGCGLLLGLEEVKWAIWAQEAIWDREACIVTLDHLQETP